MPCECQCLDRQRPYCQHSLPWPPQRKAGAVLLERPSEREALLGISASKPSGEARGSDHWDLCANWGQLGPAERPAAERSHLGWQVINRFCLTSLHSFEEVCYTAMHNWQIKTALFFSKANFCAVETSLHFLRSQHLVSPWTLVTCLMMYYSLTVLASRKAPFETIIHPRNCQCDASTGKQLSKTIQDTRIFASSLPSIQFYLPVYALVFPQKAISEKSLKFTNPESWSHSSCIWNHLAFDW